MKFLLFPLLWFLTGNFFFSLLILFLVIYFLDRKFVGILPNVWRPFQLRSRARKAKLEVQANSHHTSMKLELARLYIEQRKYKAALPLLTEILEMMGDSADVRYEIGICHLKLGNLDIGESYMLEALALNPRVKFGEPYLRLSEALAIKSPQKALGYIEDFKQTHSSSCEAYYRLAQIYERLKLPKESKQAVREVMLVYKQLPRYSRKQQRKWAWKARYRLIFG